MTPTEYEKAVLEYFRIAWPPPRYRVEHDIVLPGRKSLAARQIDVSVWEEGRAEPLMIVEAKRHARRIDIGAAGATIALVQDVESRLAVMVSTNGFSLAARNHLGAECIDHLTITLRDAHSLHWIPEIKKRFSIDGEFAVASGALVEAIRGNFSDAFISTIDLPFEEWNAVIQVGLSRFPEQTYDVLHVIAEKHIDDGHRYNAIQILSDNNLIDRGTIQRLKQSEADPDTLDLLELLTED